MAFRWQNPVTIGALFMATFSLSACTDEGASSAGPAIDTDRVTTDPDVALANLDARIRGIEAAVARRPDDVLLRRLAVEQLLSRAAFTGSYGDDFARAEAVVAGAGQVDDAARHRLVARLASALHRFDDAQDALDRAAGLGQGDPDAEVTTAVAVGLGLPEALRRAEAAAADRPSLDTYVALGAAESALGMFDAADRHFRMAADAVIDPSPFVVAYVAFQRGVMWAELADRPDLARPLYEEAVRRLPGYPVANVHLAEIEAESGDLGRALERLDRVAAVSADPEPVGYLGELLLARDPDSAEGRLLVEEAQSRYEVLLADYPEAFADHASEFFAGPGGDPERGLSLALGNLERRENARAFIVALGAAEAAGDDEMRCAVARRAKDAALPAPSLDAVLASVAPDC